MSELNEIFHEFSLAFAGRITGDGQIAMPKKLDRKRLDFSLDSLKIVDEYLKYLHHKRKKISPDEWYITVLWGGAYIGEVIRRNALRKYEWVDYKDYMPRHRELQQLIPERTVSVCAFLCDETDYITMPLNKVARFIGEGPENNTHFYASCDCKR